MREDKKERERGREREGERERGRERERVIGKNEMDMRDIYRER